MDKGWLVRVPEFICVSSTWDVLGQLGLIANQRTCRIFYPANRGGGESGTGDMGSSPTP
jgi:hypothetical protein